MDYVTGGSAGPLGKGKNTLRTRKALTLPSSPGSHIFNEEKQGFGEDMVFFSMANRQTGLWKEFNRINKRIRDIMG